jgi:tetrahydromethanopterin S-methyltransferase subunit B
MIAERTGDALIYSNDKEMIEEMDEELANVIEDFLRAIDVETLRLAKKSGKHSWSQYGVRPF